MEKRKKGGGAGKGKRERQAAVVARGNKKEGNWEKGERGRNVGNAISTGRYKAEGFTSRHHNIRIALALLARAYKKPAYSSSFTFEG